jgi:hypothetical protein
MPFPSGVTRGRQQGHPVFEQGIGLGERGQAPLEAGRALSERGHERPEGGTGPKRA